MSEYSDKKTSITPESICPHLGLDDDRATSMSYPSNQNFCHHVKPPATPKLSYQRSNCLSPEHINCQVFNTPAGQNMPKNLRFRQPGPSINFKNILMAMVIILIIIVIILGILFGEEWFAELAGSSAPTQVQTQPAAWIVALTQSVVEKTDHFKGTMQVQLSPTQTALPQTPTPLTATPITQDPLLALETPIGQEHQFIIHRVAQGESLQLYADIYNTTVEAIFMVNYELLSPLWIDYLVIIPLNQTDVSDLPAFTAYEVLEEGISVENLAEQLDVSLIDMCLYNALDPDHILHEGEWLLVPYERLAP